MTDLGRFGVTVRSRSIRANERLDASFFSSVSVQAAEQIALLEASGVPVGTIGSIGSATMPPRTALARAASAEESLPYLRPYDVFDYLPTPADRVSTTRNRNISEFRIKSGVILQTRSGRNLGPCTVADDVLAQFALSDDMVRIEVPDERDRLLLLAFLKTSLGQALIRRGRSGSVIDHLGVADVEAVPVPELPPDICDQIVQDMREAVRLRQQGRVAIAACQKIIAERYPFDEPSFFTWWQTRARKLADRLDAGHHLPAVSVGRKQLLAAGGGELGDMGLAVLPVRYKRYYVDAKYGRPIVSGRQLLQPEPINLRYVSDRSFRNPSEYELRAGFTVFGAVGRSEGRQAWPALVTSDRDGWLASNDVMRVFPRSGVRPGALWLAIAAPQVQAQIKALSFGSVVDHMNPWDVEKVVVPVVDDDLALAAEQGWDDLAASVALVERGTTAMAEGLSSLASAV